MDYDIDIYNRNDRQDGTPICEATFMSFEEPSRQYTLAELLELANQWIANRGFTNRVKRIEQLPAGGGWRDRVRVVLLLGEGELMY